MILRNIRKFARVEKNVSEKVPAVMDVEELAERELKIHEEELYKKHSQLQ